MTVEVIGNQHNEHTVTANEPFFESLVGIMVESQVPDLFRQPICQYRFIGVFSNDFIDIDTVKSPKVDGFSPKAQALVECL